jgi:hypothetical protein
MEYQDGRFVGGKRSVDQCGSRYFTYKNFSKRLEKVGFEGEEYNLVLSLIFSIIECVRGHYDQQILG